MYVHILSVKMVQKWNFKFVCMTQKTKLEYNWFLLSLCSIQIYNWQISYKISSLIYLLSWNLYLITLCQSFIYNSRQNKFNRICTVNPHYILYYLEVIMYILYICIFGGYHVHIVYIYMKSNSLSRTNYLHVKEDEYSVYLTSSLILSLPSLLSLAQ